MKKSGFLGLVLVASASLLLGACSSGGKTTKAEASGKASMALTNGAGDCVIGTIEVRNAAGDTLLVSKATDCTTSTTFTPLLPPGTYSVTMASDPAYSCVPASVPPGTTYNTCVLNPVTPFTVTAGQTTNVPLSFTFSFNGVADVTVLFTAGAADITMGDSVDGGTRLLCGSTGVVCSDTQVCATVDVEAGPLCYNTCQSSATCGTAQSCLPIAEAGVLYTETPLSSLAMVCVPGQ